MEASWSFRNWRPVDTDAHVHGAYEYKYMIMIIITMTHIYNIHNIYIYITGGYKPGGYGFQQLKLRPNVMGSNN